MVRCRIFLGFIVILAVCTNLAAQSGYKGKEFWLAFPQNARAESEYPIEQTVYITGPEGTQGLVKETATGNEYPFTLNALGFWKCQIDSVNTIIAEGKHKESVHVVTTEDVSVMAVSHRKASSDSYTAIPSQRLGNEYVITGYDPIPNIGAFATQFDVIATENDTKVTVRYPAAVVFDTTPRVETLDRGEVLHLGGKVTSITADLTGTIVLADKPVAVLTGHSCAQIPSKTNYCNLLIEMLPPATALGTEHVVARLAERERYTIRVVAVYDNTEVRVDGKRRL